jgi:hypothetical protein
VADLPDSWEHASPINQVVESFQPADCF